ncbi:hypothetical protein ILYODFUR_001422, partial [Ilyodon furcidens]
ERLLRIQTGLILSPPCLHALNSVRIQVKRRNGLLAVKKDANRNLMGRPKPQQPRERMQREKTHVL